MRNKENFRAIWRTDRPAAGVDERFVGALRELLASGQVKQGDRVLSNRIERIDTRNGPITVGRGTTIYDWTDHSVS